MGSNRISSSRGNKPGAFFFLQLDYRAEPQIIDLPPCNGRQVAVIEGPAGEWLELID